MTSIFATPVEPSAKPSGTIRKDHDDYFDSFSVYDAAAAAQFVATAVVDRDLTGAADRVADALRSTIQTGSRVARLQRRLVHQFRHSRRRHYVGFVCRRLEWNGSNYGYEWGGDGSPARLADQPGG